MFRTLALASLVVLTTAAQAAPVAVHFSDLDLSRQADVQRLADRIAAAAQSACSLDYGSDGQASRLVEARDRQQDCVRKASRTALAQAKAVMTAQQHRLGTLARN